MSKRKLTKCECFILLNIVSMYLLHFIVLLLMAFEKGNRSIDFEFIYMMLITPFVLMGMSYMTTIPTLVMMLVLTLCLKGRFILSYWLSLGFYLYLTYFMFDSNLHISCVTSTVLAGAMVTGIFWKVCKRIDEDIKYEAWLES
ncbi:hypothetical protein [Myroides profundi]|uniref:Uncharacterized protein n=1 Tax=Myroides profundi TaxID=480520 RepID=A0AAJ4W3K8_MYRPR|nr:hypothetical protein [Myroides profundi]SEQ80203.1 hypothetical protein SAMN04488089_10681 [Myroides profundi]